MARDPSSPRRWVTHSAASSAGNFSRNTFSALAVWLVTSTRFSVASR